MGCHCLLLNFSYRDAKLLHQHSLAKYHSVIHGILYCSIRIFKHWSEPFKLIPNSVMGDHLHEFFFQLIKKDYHGESVSTQIRLSTTRSPLIYLRLPGILALTVQCNCSSTAGAPQLCHLAPLASPFLVTRTMGSWHLWLFFLSLSTS